MAHWCCWLLRRAPASSERTGPSPYACKVQAETNSFLIRSFYPALDARDSSPLEPHQRLLDVSQRDGVLAARERAGLEGAQPIDHDGEQSLLGDAVDAELFDRAV